MDPDRSAGTPGRRGRRGGVRRVLAGLALGVLCIVLAVVAFPLVLELTACSAGEQRVFAEVPHYGGVRLRPSGNADAGSCMVTYRAPASAERVLAHYRQALRSRGWSLQPLQANTGRDLEGRQFRSGELQARRGDDTFAVLYEGGPALEGGGTHVAVHVSRG